MVMTDYSDDIQTDFDPPPADNDSLEGRELVQTVLEVSKGYGSEMQEAFIMYYVKDYKYEEISQRFNIPISTLATRFEGIKQKIKDKLK